jgi:BlaI family transcriptional regulator, penicillinase repressor
MARPPSTVLTDAELRVMRVLWERGGEATIGDVCDVLDPPAARATVQTMLRILERKRYVRHRADGRTFVYRALVDDEAASQRAVDHLVERFFDRSEDALVMRLLDRRGVDAVTLERVRALLDEEDAS